LRTDRRAGSAGRAARDRLMVMTASSRVSVLLDEVLAATERDQTRLDELDAVAGDGDHGATMILGWRAAVSAVSSPGGRDVPQLLRDAGAAFADVGGSIGPLWGTALLRAGRALEGRQLSPRTVAAALDAAVAGVAEIGRSCEGDKTLLDVLGPSVRAFTAVADAGGGTQEAVAAASAAADRALAATSELSPRRGRASRAPMRSVGHQDPGAASAALVWSVARGVL
jgi:dihydroxyacetone kinase-like protein